MEPHHDGEKKGPPEKEHPHSPEKPEEEHHERSKSDPNPPVSVHPTPESDKLELNPFRAIRKSIVEIFNLPNILAAEVTAMMEHPQVAKIGHLYLSTSTIPMSPILSPMLARTKFKSVYGGQGIIPEETFVYPLSLVRLETQISPMKDVPDTFFIKAGPRKHMYFDPKKVVAAVVTCGGLCPGLNVVIREIVHTLYGNYGCQKVYGIQYGYRGFYTYNWIELTPESTKHIHKEGGTRLGSSRGGFDLAKIMKKIKGKGVNQIYLVGGDGTMRGASVLFEAIHKEKLEISVIGLPKTIDNDIGVIDRSFGYQTSVEAAVQAINSAETEAYSAEYGVGLVKLMGRAAGHIALEACLSHRGVSILLIPEIPFELYGKEGLLEYVFKTLVARHHCVIVVAEGASEAAKDFKLESLGKDPSGNPKLPDIGVFLKEKIIEHCKEKGLEVTLKYIDPTYMIRTIPSNSLDTNDCSALAYDAVNGAMSGFTGFCTGIVNNKAVYIPLNMLTREPRRVKPESKTYQRLIAATGQPSFINNEEEIALPLFSELSTQKSEGFT